MPATVRDWAALAFFLSIPLWADFGKYGASGTYVLLGVAVHGLETVVEYGDPHLYAKINAKASWLQSFVVNLATCALVCNFFTLQGWRWAILYTTLVARWANPVLEAEKDAVTRLIVAYRKKYNEPQRLFHAFGITIPIVALLTFSFSAERVGGLQLAAIAFHLLLSAQYAWVAWTQV